MFVDNQIRILKNRMKIYCIEKITKFMCNAVTCRCCCEKLRKLNLLYTQNFRKKINFGVKIYITKFKKKKTSTSYVIVNEFIFKKNICLF